VANKNAMYNNLIQYYYNEVAEKLLI